MDFVASFFINIRNIFSIFKSLVISVPKYLYDGTSPRASPLQERVRELCSSLWLNKQYLDLD